MVRGEVYWADLHPRSGSEQSGRRPVLIISHDGFNCVPTWQSVVVVPLSTSANQARRGPTAVSLPKGTGGLPSASLALCHQITTLDRRKLTERIGTLPKALLREVEQGLLFAVGIEA